MRAEANDDLIDLFEIHFYRDRIARKRRSNKTRIRVRGNFRRAIAMLTSILGRPAKIDDITRDNVAYVWEYANEHGLAYATSDEMIKCLRRLSRWGWLIGMTSVKDFAPRKRRLKPQRPVKLEAPKVAKPRKVYRVPPTPPAPGTLRHVASVYAYERLLNRSEKTKQDLHTVMAALYAHFGRDILVTEQTNELAADHFRWLLATGCRPRTVNRHRAVFFAVWRFACERGLYDRLPMVRALKVELDPPDAWSEDEFKAILAAARGFHEYRKLIGGIRPELFWPALLLTAYYTGLRRRALFDLRQSDVDLESGWILVRGRSMKTGHGQRFRVGADCVAALRAIWLPLRGIVFPLTTFRSLNLHFKKILRAAGIPMSERKGFGLFHKCRRTTATIVAAKRGLRAAADLLGHSAEVMTLRYLDESKLPDRDATAFLPMLGDDPVAGA